MADAFEINEDEARIKAQLKLLNTTLPARLGTSLNPNAATERACPAEATGEINRSYLESVSPAVVESSQALCRTLYHTNPLLFYVLNCVTTADTLRGDLVRLLDWYTQSYGLITHSKETGERTYLLENLYAMARFPEPWVNFVLLFHLAWFGEGRRRWITADTIPEATRALLIAFATQKLAKDCAVFINGNYASNDMNDGREWVVQVSNVLRAFTLVFEAPVQVVGTPVR